MQVEPYKAGSDTPISEKICPRLIIFTKNHWLLLNIYSILSYLRFEKKLCGFAFFQMNSGFRKKPVSCTACLLTFTRHKNQYEL
jgi:hypothetical protein